MTTDLKKLRTDVIRRLALCDDPAFNADELIRHFLGFDRKRMLMEPAAEIAPAALAALEQAVSDRADGEPLQYILGEWDFFGRTYAVRRTVLIPRPETEALADLAIGFCRARGAKTVCDLCCGTGCIGISIALACPDARVILADISPDALDCARENAERLGAKNAVVTSCDVLRGFDPGMEAPDVIVCNPPYVPTGELGSLQREVRREPALALDGGADGLVFYRALCEKWLDALRPGGGFFFECGEEQPEQVAAMCDRTRFEARVVNDYCGVPRFVAGRKTE